MSFVFASTNRRLLRMARNPQRRLTLPSGFLVIVFGTVAHFIATSGEVAQQHWQSAA